MIQDRSNRRDAEFAEEGSEYQEQSIYGRTRCLSAETLFKKMRGDLIGMPLSHLWRGYGSAILLEFGVLTPSGKRRDGSERNPKGEFTVGIEWSWRIENPSSIVCGSWSDEEYWEPAFDLIRTKQVSEIEIFCHLPEVVITFENGYRILLFNTSEGQPEWYIIDRRLEQITTLKAEGGCLAIEEKK